MTRPRRIPDRGMPHRASIELCTGQTARGPVWGEPQAAVRANFNGGARRSPAGRAIQAGGFDAVAMGEVVLDEQQLPLLSRITNEATGTALLVGAVERWDQPPVAPFLVVTLVQLVA